MVTYVAPKGLSLLRALKEKARDRIEFEVIGKGRRMKGWKLPYWRKKGDGQAMKS